MDTNTPSGNPFLDLARDAFTDSTSYFDAGIRAELEASLRQFQGQHPTGSKYLHESYRARSRFFRPKTRAAVRKNEAIAAQALFGNTDVVTLMPEDGTDRKQAQGAAVWNEVINHRLTKTIPWFQTVIGAYQDAQVAGLCVSYQYWKYDARRKIDQPCVELLPLENVRFSPAASWIDPVSTSPYFIRMIPMYVKDVLAMTRAVDPKTNMPKWKPIAAENLLKAANSYSDSTSLQRNRGRPDKTNYSAITDFSTVWIHQNFIELNGIDYVYHTLGTLDMLTVPVPVETVYPLSGRRPFVVGTCVIEAHKSFPDSPVRLSRDIQGELNENANQRSDNVKFAMNKRYFVKRGRQVDTRSLQRNVPSSVTMMEDPEHDVKVLDTPDVTASAYQEQDRLNLDFDDLVGNFSQASVGSNRKLSETVGGMEMLTEDANQLADYQLRIFVETWVEPVLRQILLLEMAYETDEKIFTVAGKKAMAAQRTNDAILIDDDMLRQELTINVDVGIGATSPKVRLSRLIWALKSVREIIEGGELLKAGADIKEVVDEIFSQMGYDGADRFFPNVSEDPQVQSLKIQLDEAMAKLAKREDPELTAAKVKKLLAEVDKIGASKVKEMVEAIFGSMQAAEVIAAVPMVTPIADQIMRAGGYTPPMPTGTDPGFAPGEQGPNTNVASMAAPGLTVDPVTNKRSGVGFQPGTGAPPGGAAPPSAAPGGGLGQDHTPGIPTSTNPLTPAKPASPFVGPNHGIETQRPDSQGPTQ